MSGLKYKTLREQVVAELRECILNGDCHVGEKINEVELSKKFGISRGPVREALRQIEQEGLVEYTPNKGCRVKMLSKVNVYEIYLIRSNLECLAVEIYKGIMSEQMIAELTRIVKELGKAAKAESLVDIVKWDELFHATIVKEAQLPRLYDTWKSFEGENAAIYYTMNEKHLMPTQYLQRNHQWLIDAFIKNDLEYSVKCIKEHYIIVPAQYDE